MSINTLALNLELGRFEFYIVMTLTAFGVGAFLEYDPIQMKRVGIALILGWFAINFVWNFKKEEEDVPEQPSSDGGYA